MTASKFSKAPIVLISLLLTLHGFSQTQNIESPPTQVKGSLASEKNGSQGNENKSSRSGYGNDSLITINRGSDKLTNNYVIEYDFSTGLYTENTVKPKVHIPVIYKIKNINRYAYKIEIKSKDSVLAFSFTLDGLPKEIFVAPKKDQETTSTSTDESPAPLTGVNSNDVKDVANETPENKMDLVKLLNSTVKIIELNRQIATDSEKLKVVSEKISQNQAFLKKDLDEIKVLKDSVNTKIQELENSNDASAVNSNLTDLKAMSKIIADNESLIKEEAKLARKLKTSKNDMEDLKTTQGALESFVKENEKLGEQFLQFRQTYREVNKINQCYEKLYELITYHQLTKEIADEKIKYFADKQKNEFDGYQDQIAILRSRYYDMQVQYGILKRNFPLNDKLSESGQAKLYGQADDYMSRAKNMFEKINLSDVQKKMNLMPFIIESLGNPDTFELKSPPIEVTGDVVTFNIDIQAKNKTEDKILNERKFKHQEFTYGGTRIDFGLGLAGSYFDHTPIHELQVKTVDTLSEITVQKKSNQLIVPSLIGLATMSHRSSRYTCFGGSAGLGIDVVNGKIQLSNFFIGPSVTFGRYERLTLTAGATLRNVQQLKSGYKIGSKVTGTSDDIENYLTDKYKVGFFASLTVVLTKGVKENLKAIPSYR
jgi:hypothetical protein